MIRSTAPLTLVTLVALTSGCHASSVQAGQESLGLVTIVIVGGALLVALLAYLYGAKGGPKGDE